MSYHSPPRRTRSPIFGGAAEDYYFNNPIAKQQLADHYPHPRRRSSSAHEGSRYYDDYRGPHPHPRRRGHPRSHYAPRPPPPPRQRSPPPPPPPSSTHHSDRDYRPPRRRPRSHAPPQQRSKHNDTHGSCEGGTCKELEKQYGGFSWGEGIELALVGALTIFSFDKAYHKHKQKSEEREARRERDKEREKVEEKKRSRSQQPREKSRPRSRSRTWGDCDDFDEANFTDGSKDRRGTGVSFGDEDDESLADDSEREVKRRPSIEAPNRRRDESRDNKERKRRSSRSRSLASPRRGETW